MPRMADKKITRTDIPDEFVEEVYEYYHPETGIVPIKGITKKMILLATQKYINYAESEDGKKYAEVLFDSDCRNIVKNFVVEDFLNPLPEVDYDYFEELAEAAWEDVWDEWYGEEEWREDESEVTYEEWLNDRKEEYIAQTAKDMWKRTL